MNTIQSKTDREGSIAASEFVWDGSEVSPFHHLVAGRIIQTLRTSNVTSVLDLGCGNGSFTNLIRKSGFFPVVGIDGSESGVEIARKFFSGIDFDCQDLTEEIPAELHGKFDAVVCLEVIEHMLLPRTLLNNAMRALRPGGILLLSTPYHGYIKNIAIALAGGFDNHWHPLRDYGHIKFFSRKTIEQIVRECGFDLVDYFTVGRVRILAHSMVVVAKRPG